MLTPFRERQERPADWELIHTLMQDVELACTALAQEPDQYARRTAFRAAFAAVEGLTFYMKQEALRDPGEYTSQELALLREKGYGLGSGGQVTVTSRRLPSADNFLFAIRMAIRPLVRDFVIEPRDPGVLAFTQAIRVRHRVKHPKRLDDLHITDKEARSLLEALSWCYALVMRYEQAVHDVLATTHENIEQIMWVFGDQVGDRKRTEC